MKNTFTVVQMLIRLVGLVLLVLGIIFWIGQDLDLIIFHIVFGIVFALLLWVMAVLGAIKKISGWLVAIMAVWGFVLPVFGLTQSQIYPGPFHWGIDVLHLLFGLGAVGFAEVVGRQIKEKLYVEESAPRPRSRARAIHR
jgi:hypothetical protein